MLTRRIPISIDEAIERLKRVPLPTTTETIPLSDANHRVLAKTINAPFAYPHFRRSGVDGFAIKSSDDHDFPKKFKVLGEIQAGATFDRPLGPNECARIMTGAFVPDDASKVIMLEKTRTVADHPDEVNMLRTEKKSNITEVGSEFHTGDPLIVANSELNPGGLALLTAFGIDKVEVYRKPKVAIITTGTELMHQGDPLQKGKIYNANGIQIKNLVLENGGNVTETLQLIDDADLLRTTLDKAIAENDIVITDGAVSVGDFDFVGDAARNADNMLFNKLKMRPGSVTTAFIDHNTLILALSGNPGACFVGFYLYVEPVLHRFTHQLSKVKQINATLAGPFTKTNGFDRILRGTYVEKGLHFDVYPNGSAQSGVLGNLQTTTCLIKIPHSNTPIELNAKVTAWLLPYK